MDTQVQAPDDTLESIDSKATIDNVELKASNENEPVFKKPKLEENKVDGKTEVIEEIKNVACNVLDDDDSDDDIELDKNGFLYFLERLTTTETTREQKLEEFKEYLEKDLSSEMDQIRLKPKQNLSDNKKEIEAKEEKKSDNKDKDDKKKDDSDDEDINSEEHEVPEPGFNYPLEQDASDMLDDVDFAEDGSFPSVTERYLTPYYAIDVKEPCDDVCILIHSNRICMITLAPSHIIFQQNKTITACDYQVSERLDRTKNKVSGKGKRGAQCMQKNSYLCRLTCSDGSIYMIRCCMNGKLMEVNERLVEDPEILKKPPHFGGYIAVVLPNLRYHDEQLKKHLLDQKQYEEAIKKRNEKKDLEAVASEENKNKEENKIEEKLLKTEIHQEDKNKQAADLIDDKKQGKEELDDVDMVEVKETK